MDFSDRHQIEEHLASLTTTGAIVEIGCGFGNGLVTLAKGNINNLPIYGVDPYIEYRDPLGGAYGPDTKAEMRERTKDIRFTHIELPALEAAQRWNEPIGLLWIDLSMPYDKLRQVVTAWHKYISPGGYLAITGLSYSQLGTLEIFNELAITGHYEDSALPNDLVAVLRKKEQKTRRAAFYIAGRSHSYAQEATVSAESVKRQLGIDTFLFASTEIKRPHPEFNEVVLLPSPKYPNWYRNQVWYHNQAVNHLNDYDQLLYLDTDTYICRDCSTIWRILDNYDMACGHAAGRGATPTAVDCPSEFATLGVGVNLFRNTPKIRRFFDDWLEMFEAHYDIYGETDEGPFRDLLFLNKHDIRYFVLAPEEHCRFGFGVWLNGSVSILHGRVDRPLAKIAEEINSITQMRIYRYNGDENNFLWWHNV